MLNSTIFVGGEAREALMKSMFDDEQKHIGDDWCAGGRKCKSFKETEEGRALKKDLNERLIKWGEENPEKIKEFMKQVRGRK